MVEKIIQYGFPGSGSTLIYQILKYLFDNVKKKHSFIKYKEDIKIVATVRDFRDCLCTELKRKDLTINERNIKKSIDYFKKGLYHFIPLNLNLKEWSNKRNILWLKYEDFFNNFDYIFTQLEDFFDIKISDEQRNHIISNYSLSTNKKRSKNFQNFSQYDVKSQIHGNHITSNGQINKWNEIIPRNLHKLTNQLLWTHLKRWDYI